MIKYKFKSRIVQIVLVSTFYLLLPALSFAQPVPSTDLIENAKDYDGKTVVYEGEVIGEIMPRGDYAWINVNDGKNSIGIWINKDLIKGIVYNGDYKHIGDRIEVLGLFHRACLQHGGDLDIHAYQITRRLIGREVNWTLDPEKKKIAIYLGVALCSLLLLKTLKPKR